MTLQLVTGPTNASKAGVVLGLVRQWAAEGRSPILVVPTGPDAVRYRRELLGISGGVVNGVTVGTFGRLEEIVRRRADLPARTLGPVRADRLLATALARVRPGRPLAGTAPRRGVRRRLLALLEELAERGYTATALADELQALDPTAHGVDALLVEDLRTVLEAVSAADRDAAADGAPPPSPATLARRARVALGNDLAGWRGRPVAWYGFDDLTFAQLALVRTLARAADVVVSLPFQDGRTATAARHDVVTELRRIAEQTPADAIGRTGALPLTAASPVLEGARVARIDRREVTLAPADPTGGRGRLQQRLFEPDAGEAEDAAATLVSDVVLLEGGDARSEAELVADAVLRAVDELDLEWHDVAIAVREAAGPPGARLERELTARGVPVARPRQMPARRTALGRTLGALGRIALGTGDADDVVRVLRAGAAPTAAGPVDRLAIALRRDGVTDAATAIRRAAQTVPLLDGQSLVALAADRRAPTGAGELVALLTTAQETLVRGLAAPTVAPEREQERQAAGAIAPFLQQVAALPPALLPDPAEVLEELAELPVPAGAPPGDRRVEIAAPGALRGRQVAVLVIAGLSERAFPAPDPIDPLIDRDARSVLAAAGRVPLQVPVDRLAAERMLFLELTGRPTRRLLLARPLGSPDGEEIPAAPFWADVVTALAPLTAATVRRGASQVRPATGRPVAAVAPLGAALDDAGRETVRRVLWEHRRFTVREVERLAQCPVAWLVEHAAGARDDQPITAAQIHGQLVHAVLDAVLRREAVGGVRYGDLDPQALVDAGRAELAARGPHAVAALPEHHGRVLLRRAETGIAATLRALPERYAHASLEATEVVIDEEGTWPPIDLGDGAIAVGRVDRIDRVPLPDGRDGVGVVDYKLGAGGAISAARWAASGTLQAGLYLHAVADAASRPAAYALYQPTAPQTGLAAGARDPKGLELRGVLTGSARGGYSAPEEVAAVVADAHARAQAAVRTLRAGDVTPPDPADAVRPCDHPAIARVLA